MNAADISPVPSSARNQSGVDLFIIFAGANIVATTLQAGAALAVDFSPAAALVLMAAGATAGSVLVAALAVVGPRLGVPSVDRRPRRARRAGRGPRGGAALRDQFRLDRREQRDRRVGGRSPARRQRGHAGVGDWPRLWSRRRRRAGGPRAVGLADRVAVPLLVAVGGVITWAVVRRPICRRSRRSRAGERWLRGLDIVVGYQVSWILMFADYSRYTKSERSARHGGVSRPALTSLWLMPLGSRPPAWPPAPIPAR